jgi:hypothetical protein
VLDARGELTEPLAAVAHQHPRPIEIDGDELWNPVGEHGTEQRRQARLEGVVGRDCLEPQRVVRRRDAEDRRPGLEVRLLEFARRFRVVADPRSCLCEPVGVAPPHR